MRAEAVRTLASIGILLDVVSEKAAVSLLDFPIVRVGKKSVPMEARLETYKYYCYDGKKHHSAALFSARSCL